MPASKFSSYSSRRFSKEEVKRCKVLITLGLTSLEIAKRMGGYCYPQWVDGVRRGIIHKKVEPTDEDYAALRGEGAI